MHWKSLSKLKSRNLHEVRLASQLVALWLGQLPISGKVSPVVG